MHRFKPFVLASLAVAMLVGSVAPAAAAGPGSTSGSNVAEAWFYGTATSGAPAPYMPININPADLRFRSDGAIGIGYVYTARGDAKGSGQASGTFLYEEHGYLYFMNPSDPTTYMGSQFVSGVFVLSLKKGGPPVVIADTSPSAYSSGVNSVSASSLPHGALKAIAQVYGKNLGQLKGGSLTYGYFTFTNNYGAFTGYATPDFRQFAIAIKFDCPGCK